MKKKETKNSKPSNPLEFRKPSLPLLKSGLTSAKKTTFVILTIKFLFRLVEHPPVSPMIEFLFEFFCYSCVEQIANK